MSLRNWTAERRGRQKVCLSQTRWGYFLWVLSWASINNTVSGLLQKDLFKGRRSLAENIFKDNHCPACQTRFAVSFPPQSFCVRSLIDRFRVTFTANCTTWRSFPFSCRLLFITSTHKTSSCTLVYYRKLSAWIWRLPFTVNITLNLSAINRWRQRAHRYSLPSKEEIRKEGHVVLSLLSRRLGES